MYSIHSRLSIFLHSVDSRCLYAYLNIAPENQGACKATKILVLLIPLLLMPFFQTDRHYIDVKIINKYLPNKDIDRLSVAGVR